MKIAYADSAVDLDLHYHNTHELLYVAAGRVRVAIRRTVYDVWPGSAVFINNLEEHATQVLAAPYRRYFLTVSAQELQALVKNPMLSSVFRMRPQNFSHVAAFEGGNERVESFFRDMLRESSQSDLLSEECMGHHLSLLLSWMYRKNPQAFPAHGRPLSAMVQQAQQYIDRHFTEPVRVQDLAESLYVSAGWLSHAFRREIGLSPRQYIQLMRLSAARELLLHEKVSVSEAARLCCFPDASSFIRCFHEHYGITPKQLQLTQKS